MKSLFQLKRNKNAFSLIEFIISIFLISILLYGIINLKDYLAIGRNDIFSKNESKRRIYDAALFIENKIKKIDDFKKIEDVLFQDTLLFTDITKKDGIPKDYNYFFFQLKNRKLMYRANTSSKPLKKTNYNNFSASNYIAEDVVDFELYYDSGLFKFKIVDKYGNEVNKTVLSGVLNE